MKAAIIGLGLIGGSLGLNLVKNKFISTVYGIDSNPEHEAAALELGIVHELSPNLAECDLIFICTPVSAACKIIANLPPLGEHTSVVDFSSCKQEIAHFIPPHLAKQFILAHPMAGTEHSGPKAAFAELFCGAVCVLCDAERADVAHLHRIIELLTSMQMRLAFMSIKEHDHHSAIISHLPHAISFALANYVLGCERAENIVHMAGGSFSDMSRIAKSSPAMWGSIFEHNHANVLAALDGFINELERFKNMLASNKAAELDAWMQRANCLKDIL